MITVAERKKIRNYFKKFPTWTIWGLLISFPFTLFYGVGIIGMLIAGIFMYRWMQRINDKQFDFYKNKSLDELRKMALAKLRLHETQLVRQDECIISPIYEKTGIAESYWKLGKDKFTRYTPIRANLIFFTEHKLCIYQCVLDLITGNPLNVRSSKFYYKAIVSINTMSDTRVMREEELNPKVLKNLRKQKKNSVNGVIQFNQSESLVLTTSGGNTLKIELPDYNILNFGQIDTRADQAIASVEAMVDSKKYN